MLLRLLLTLLIASLAAPAVAMPAHCKPQAVARVAHHGGHNGPGHEAPAPASLVKAHDCIGCVAPVAGMPEMILPYPHGKPPLAVTESLFHRLLTIAPDTPPPRP